MIVENKKNRSCTNNRIYIEKPQVHVFYKCSFKHTIEDIYIQNSTIGVAHNDVVPPRNCPIN